MLKWHNNEQIMMHPHINKSTYHGDRADLAITLAGQGAPYTSISFSEQVSQKLLPWTPRPL
jgi:hypothetical protein